jgi:hypothetical protein
MAYESGRWLGSLVVFARLLPLCWIPFPKWLLDQWRRLLNPNLSVLAIRVYRRRPAE